MATHQKAHTKNRGTKELIFRNEKEGEEYAEVEAPNGDARFECRLLNGTTVIAKLAGRLIRGPNKQYIKKNDFVLLQLDKASSGADKYYIIHKYSPDEKKKLAKNGELVQIKSVVEEENSAAIVFEDEATTTTKQQEAEVDEDFIDNI